MNTEEILHTINSKINDAQFRMVGLSEKITIALTELRMLGEHKSSLIDIREKINKELEKNKASK